MRMEWQTPLYRVSLASVARDVPQTTKHLATLLLSHYERLLQDNAGRFASNSWSPNGPNQVGGAFFQLDVVI